MPPKKAPAGPSKKADTKKKEKIIEVSCCTLTAAAGIIVHLDVILN